MNKEDNVIIPEGKIDPDSDGGNALDFRSDKFSHDSYLWRIGNDVYISFIESLHPGKGYFRDLLTNIQRAGFTPCIPTPFARMRQILSRLGFVSTHEPDADSGDICEVWRPKRGDAK